MSGIATAIVGSAVIGTTGGLVGGKLQSDAAKNAGQVSKETMENSALFSFFAGKHAEAELQPFYDAAVQGIPYTQEAAQRYSEMSQAGPGKFEDSGYFNAMNLGIDRAAREMGTATSGSGQGYGRNLMKYATGLAGEKFGAHQGEWMNRLNALRGQPQVYPNAPAQMAQLHQDTGRNVTSAIQGAGAAEANAILGQGAGQVQGISDATGAVSNAMGMYSMYNMMNPGTPQPQVNPMQSQGYYPSPSLPSNPFYGPGGMVS